MKSFFYLAIFVFAITSCEKDTIEKLIDPKLILSDDTLTFNGDQVKSFFISTKPATESQFQITSIPSWVKVSPTSGSITKDIVEIQVSSEFTSGLPGNYIGNLIIMSTSGTDTVFLKGFVDENLVYTIPDSLKFSIFASNQSFVIKNEGNIPLTFSASAVNDYISMPTNSGSLSVGQQQNIFVNVNRSAMETGNYRSKVLLNINGQNDTIEVSINNFKEQKLILTSDVIDAEYSKSKDILVYVPSTPDKAYIYNPSLGTTESISLDYSPTCVSISSNGETAVIGHDGHITYLDLSNKVILKTFSVSCNALDIVLGNNKWAYVFPKENQWENIRCINIDLTNDNEVLQTGNYIYAGTKARLHPSGKYIYGANNGLTPSDVEKYNIQNGGAAYMYDSPYHGDYLMSGDLWFSEDGLRVFTRGKTVLKTSEIKEQDMIYNGTIALESTYAHIMWLDHSTVKNNLYLISSVDDYWTNKNKPYVYVYNSNNLTYKSKFDLEKYLVPDNNGGGNFYDAEPYFVFSNSAGNNIFILIKANGSGLVNEWAIQKIKIE